VDEHHVLRVFGDESRLDVKGVQVSLLT